VWLDASENAVNNDNDVGLRAKHLALGAEACVGAATGRVDGASAPAGSAESSSVPRPCLGPSAPLQRAVSRNVYATEYAQSIQECFFMPRSSSSCSSTSENSGAVGQVGTGNDRASGEIGKRQELSGPGRYMVAQHWARVKAVEQSNQDLTSFIQDLIKIKTEREKG